MESPETAQTSPDLLVSNQAILLRIKITGCLKTLMFRLKILKFILLAEVRLSMLGTSIRHIQYCGGP